MSISSLYEPIRPTLNLNFARSRRLDPRITFTRASTGTFVDRGGVLKTALTDQSRFTHDPSTGESLGLLVEEARTNSISNNTMVGAVAGTPGTLPTNWSILGGTGLTTQVVGTGTENGISYIDIRFSGTTSSTFTGVQFAGSVSGFVTGTAYTGSVYMRRTAGALTNLTNPKIFIRYNLSPSGQTDISSTVSSLAGPTESLATSRYTVTGTTAGTLLGTGSMFVLFDHSSGVAVDITLRIGLPQLELGAFATSPILTSGSAATRAADVATITGTNFSRWYRQDEGTTFIQTSVLSAPIASFGFAISDGTDSNRLALFELSSDLSSRVVISGVQTNPGPVARLSGRHALTVSSARAVSCSGGVVGTSSSPSAMPAVNRVTIGSGALGTNLLNGTISRLTYWPSLLPDAVLQRLTR